MISSADAIDTMIQREHISATGEYDTVKAKPSGMDYPYTNVIEYKSYWLSMSVVFTLKHILVPSIFVFGGNKECKNGALNVVNVAISHNLKNWFVPFRS